VPLLCRPRHDGDGPLDDALGTACFTAAPADGRATSAPARRSTICPVPTDVAVLVVLWRLQDKLSLHNVAEMFLTRGFTFTHETVRTWEERLAPLLTAQLKARRRGKAGRKWRMDETYVKVAGRWCYLYRAIDSDGKLVETMLSKTRDMKAAKTFFACALKAVGQARREGDHRWPRLLPPCGTRDARPECAPSYQPVHEQPHRTGPPAASSNAPIPCAGSGPSTQPPGSVRRMTSSVTTSARAPASTTPSPSPTNAASSRTPGERCARCSRRPNRRCGETTRAYRRLQHLCVLKPDASTRPAQVRDGQVLQRSLPQRSPCPALSPCLAPRQGA